MTGMTPKERLRATFTGEPVDRLAWSPCVDGYFLSSLPADRQLDEMGLHREIGSDALLRHVLVYSTTEPRLLARTADNPRVEVSSDVRPDGAIRFTYDTKVGSLTEEMVFNPASPNIPWFTKHKLETLEDVKVYLYALETARVELRDRFFRERVEALGDDGLVTTTGPASPMEVLINLDMGVEAFTYALNDDPELMEECFAAMHEHHLAAYRVIADSTAEVVISYENTSTTLISPKGYARYEQPYCNDYAAICRDAGKIYLTHMCGLLSGFSKLFADSHQDGFVDVAQQPTGDLDLAEAKATWARDKVLMGGIDATAATTLSPEGMYDYARDLAERVRARAGGFHKFILGTGDATAKDTPLENLHAVSRAVADTPLDSHVQ